MYLNILFKCIQLHVPILEFTSHSVNAVQFSDTWLLKQSNSNEPSLTLYSLATVVKWGNYFLLFFPFEVDENQQQEKEFFSMNDIIILMMHYICLDWRHIWHIRFFRQHPLYGSCCVNNNCTQIDAINTAPTSTVLCTNSLFLSSFWWGTAFGLRMILLRNPIALVFEQIP